MKCILRDNVSSLRHGSLTSLPTFFPAITAVFFLQKKLQKPDVLILTGSSEILLDLDSLPVSVIAITLGETLKPNPVSNSFFFLSWN